ncbi:MAG: nitroreductase [Lachnospiraceae bacterium]|nr:nitroreductase [Lachnospiraceae bacterium]
MTIWEAMEQRHSVRTYLDTAIPPKIREKLDAEAEKYSLESGLHLFFRYDDPAGFDSMLAHYGRLINVKNYIVLAGKKRDGFDFDCGYYGEKLVLLAQQLGLNTCWTAMSFSKKNVRRILPEGESLCMVIALGYGKTQGSAHKNRPLSVLAPDYADAPDWFRKGADAALLAPTAMNQQHFALGFADGEATLRVRGFGPYTTVDLGIAACHFEAGSGRKPRIL